MSVAGDTAFAFGPFRLIPSQRLLVRENRPVKLGGRALDILHLLVMRAGQEVSKKDLIEFAWPNVFVDEHNLKVHISSLRRALEDTLAHATFIATVVGHGYQFVQRVQTDRVDTMVRADNRPGYRLPALFPLIGRQRDVQTVVRKLGFTRLVTLVGPGGVGKTSLAVAVAHVSHREFSNGVIFVDLSSTDEPALVPHLVATGLGVRADSSNPISAILEYLQNRRILVVLDNCEHVLHGVATLATRLVKSEMSSCLLATSREPLGVSGENQYRVEPLRVPDPSKVRNTSQALSYPAVELFALRALESVDYRLSDGDAPAVAAICQAIDGLPLAIEIVAAKLDQFSPAKLLASVGGRLSEQRNDDEATNSRHSTMWATLDWSYQLLSSTEAAMFGLLSVFVGSFEWTDVTGMAKLVQYDPYQTTTALGGLVAKSLLSAEIDGEHLRYRFLESARIYAAARLQQDPLAQDAPLQFAHLVLTMFRQSEAEWGWIGNRVWGERYEARLGDLRKALDWCFGDEGDASLGVEIAISAIRLWNEQSSIFEQLFQVERAFNHLASMKNAPKQMATIAISRAWCMTYARLPYASKEDAWNIAAKLAECSRDLGEHLSAMFGQAIFLIYTGRNEQALALMDDVIQIATRSGDRASVSDGERVRAIADLQLGNLIDAQTKFEGLAKALAHSIVPSGITCDQLQSYISIHQNLAFSYWLTGQPKRALALAEEVVLKAGQGGRLWGQSGILAIIAMPLALLSGDIDALERYVTMLQGNLDRENIELWEQVHQFYAAASRHARGDLIAVDDMRSAVDDLIRGGFLVRTPMYLGVLAEALLERGRATDADEAVETALKLQRQTKENWCLPELFRVKARILATLGERAHACAVFGGAREKARVAGARTLELRIVNDMSQMARADGNEGN